VAVLYKWHRFFFIVVPGTAVAVDVETMHVVRLQSEVDVGLFH